MKISLEKRERISEQILEYLYSTAPKASYTSHIAKEIARDEEFVKALLFELKKRGLLVDVKKNTRGEPYSRRIRWRLSDFAYKIYQQKQNTQQN